MMTTPNLEKQYDASFYNNQIQGSVNSASHCLEPLLSVYRPSSAIDIGCGRGGWLAELVSRGITDVHGVDGSPINPKDLLIKPDAFSVKDFTQPFQLGRSFDLAISLEVAEHLPEESADNFIDILTSLAPVVLFSAAIPLQGGTHHVNEQWPEYWAKKFDRNGYGWVDIVRLPVWQNAEVELWYAQNSIVYIQRDRADITEQLGVPVSQPGQVPHALVHPKLYDIKAHEAAKLRRRMNRIQPWRPLIKKLKAQKN